MCTHADTIGDYAGKRLAMRIIAILYFLSWMFTIDLNTVVGCG